MEKKKNDNPNKPQSLSEVYNGSEAGSRREQVRKEINSTPRINYNKAFEKSDVERGEFLTERKKWRDQIQKEGYSKRNHPLKTYVKIS